jgi:Tol biopolymer transport system component
LIGTTLSNYRITSRIGVGGMGEVYRADDTNLGRGVALKLLPEDFASDPERLARFEREAKLLASLNHPNVAAIHGFENVDGKRFLVLELVEGENLAERLRRGAIPVDEAIEVARQIAEALEEAHEKGIVHRDLKPGNVKLTPDGKVKVLDFGLAKAWAGDPATNSSGSGIDVSQSPTLAHSGTHAGVILGTAAYMSPEQARGKPVDRRADIWAFGVVLFEMLTGKQLFAGETFSDVLAAVLTREPDWAELPSGIPAGLRRLVGRCLERNPLLRLRDIGEARIALRQTESGSQPQHVSASQPWPGRMALLLAGLAIGLLLAGLWPRSPAAIGEPTAVLTTRFAIEARDAVPPTVSITADGRRLAFTQSVQGMSGTLWTRPLDGLEARELPGTDQVVGSFWSPDGHRVALFTRSAFLVLDAETGTIERSFDRSELARARGGSWGPKGVMLLGANDSIYRLSETGGAPEPVMEPRAGETAWQGWPSFLPDGHRFLFTSQIREGEENIPVVGVADLASPESPRILLRRAMGAFWSSGHIVYGSDRGSLHAQPVDPDTLDPTRPPLLLGEDLDYDTRTGWIAAAGSANGVVVFRKGTTPLREFVWLDRSGRTVAKASERGPWHNFDLSPDGKRIATTTLGRQQGNRLWLIEPERGVASQLSGSGSPSISDPTWSPDGKRLAFRLGDSLVVQPARGGDTTVVLDHRGYPDSWSRDGRWLLYGWADLGSYGLFAHDVTDPAAESIPLVTGLRLSDEPRFAPSGKWVAYHASSASDSTEVFVIPFPPTGERWQISSAGGVQPRWSLDGDELFYLDLEGRLMRVAAPGSDPRKAGAPTALFETGLLVSNSFDQYAIGPDDRFLFQLPVEGAEPSAPVHVVIGWETAAR